MRIHRLKWAGLRLETHQKTILIDAVEDFTASPMGKETGQVDPEETYTPVAPNSVDYVLLTHLHGDHYDPALIRRCLRPDGLVFCLDVLADTLRRDGLDRVAGFGLNQTFRAGSLTFTAVYAMDGFADPQCAWVLEDGERRILHGGDTLWHNQFWSLGARYPSFDAVFLPINGVVVHLPPPNMAFSPVPAALTPLQAVSAAQLLKAQRLCPIHFGLHRPGHYEEYPNARQETVRLAAELGVPLALLRSGQELHWQ